MWKKRDDSLRLDPKAIDAIMKARRIRNSYELSKLIGRDKNEVKAWVTGERGITWSNAHMIADALDCDIENLTGEKPFVSDPESETDSVPSVDTSSSAGAGVTATLPNTGLLGEVKIDEKDIAKWNAEEKAIFLSAIGDIIKLGCPVRLVGKPTEGCVKLNLRLTREQWQRLERAFAAGELAHLKVTKVEPFYDLGEDKTVFTDIKQPDPDQESDSWSISTQDIITLTQLFQEGPYEEFKRLLDDIYNKLYVLGSIHKAWVMRVAPYGIFVLIQNPLQLPFVSRIGFVPLKELPNPNKRPDEQIRLDQEVRVRIISCGRDNTYSTSEDYHYIVSLKCRQYD